MPYTPVFPTQPRFSDGDNNIMLHTQQDEETIWYGDYKGFYTAVIGDQAVEFQPLTSDGRPHAVPTDPELVFTGTDCRALGHVAFTRWVVLPNEQEWTLQAYSMPRVEYLNSFKRDNLEPLGAHDLPLSVADGDGNDGLFAARTMVEAIADGTFLISSSPAHYLHDTRSHGLGITSLEAETVDVLQNLCRLALKAEATDKVAAECMHHDLIQAYDVSTFYFRDTTPEGSQQINARRFDPLLSIAVQLMIRGGKSNSLIAEAVKTIDNGPFSYSPGRRSVMRYGRIIQYYAQIKQLNEPED